MKKFLFGLVAVVAIVALAAPVYALTADFSGQYRFRLMSTNNVQDGADTDKGFSDNRNFVDQRARLRTTAAPSENLRGVWFLEIGDMTWGDATGTTGKGIGGGLGGDGVNVETKQLYVDFVTPGYEALSWKVGLQGNTIHNSWFIDGGDEMTQLFATGNWDPWSLNAWFAYFQNLNQITNSDDRWNTGLSLRWRQEAWDARLSWALEKRDSINTTTGATDLESDDLHIFMGEVRYAADMWNAFLIGGLNFGERKPLPGTGPSSGANNNTGDYGGWLIDVGGTYNVANVSLALEFFYVSGDDNANDDKIDNFTYFEAASHYWAEILGNGRFDRNNTTPRPSVGNTATNGRKSALNDEPTNVMAFKVGAAYKPLDETTLTLNFWWARHDKKVVSSPTGTLDDDIGMELDFYIDQKLYDELTLSFVSAYLFAGDAFTANIQGADDAYEVGLQLLYNF